jgi:hypothetical protein
MTEAVQIMARAIYEGRNGAGCKNWTRLPGSHRGPYLTDAQAALSALESEGLVVVPAEAVRQARMMANICFNLKQSSAIEGRSRKSMDECQSAFDRAMLSARPQDKGACR